MLMNSYDIFRGVSSIEDYVAVIKEIYRSFQTKKFFLWFRGEKDYQEPLLPGIYRITCEGKKVEYSNKIENTFLQNFRLKTRIVLDNPPIRENIDEWLFLAQHYQLPTRLLDWTENALVALYFASEKDAKEQPVVWLLNPILLNYLSYNDYINNNGVLGKLNKIDEFYEFPLTWPEGSIGHINIKAAWTHDKGGTEIPVAVIPPYVDSRLFNQRSCFTIHGKDQRSLIKIISDKKFPISEKLIWKIEISREYREEINENLKFLGISRSSIFSDLQNLTSDIKDTYIRLFIK